MKSHSRITWSRRSQESSFGEMDACVSQDIVGRRDMKRELRDAEGQEQRPAGEGSPRTILESKNDFAVRVVVDGLARQALNETNRARDAGFQLIDVRFAVGKRVRAVPRQQ